MTHTARNLTLGLIALAASQTAAFSQSFTRFTSTNNDFWKESKLNAVRSTSAKPLLEVSGNETISVFRGWGTCFNELGWDALQLLPQERRDELMKGIFAPDGDLRYTHGRFSFGANDYARGWYNASEVPGDFQFKYFDMTREKSTIVPFIKAAQKYNPNLTFWCSPWSPPAWMKVNQDYPVLSNDRFNKMNPKSNIILHGDSKEFVRNKFPQKIAIQDYFIQDPRYLQAYADYFVRCISEYQKEGIPVSRVMYQNEAYSYTPYPGCAWTPKGAATFNAEYLAPTLKKHCPNVELYLGTINTNRFDEVDKILSDPRMKNVVKGIGFQWEGSQIIPEVRAKYPQYKVVQSESECGNGSFDWGAAEHTFGIINDFLGKGCEEYTFWNVILCDNGESPWGWRQNALIRVNSQARTASLTPEYFAVKHYSHFVAPGSKLLASFGGRSDAMPAMVFTNPQGKFVVVAGNRSNEVRKLTVKLGQSYLETELKPHSLNTFVQD